MYPCRLHEHAPDARCPHASKILCCRQGVGSRIARQLLLCVVGGFDMQATAVKAPISVLSRPSEKSVFRLRIFWNPRPRAETFHQSLHAVNIAQAGIQPDSETPCQPSVTHPVGKDVGECCILIFCAIVCAEVAELAALAFAPPGPPSQIVFRGQPA